MLPAIFSTGDRGSRAPLPFNRSYERKSPQSPINTIPASIESSTVGNMDAIPGGVVGGVVPAVPFPEGSVTPDVPVGRVVKAVPVVPVTVGVLLVAGVVVAVTVVMVAGVKMALTVVGWPAFTSIVDCQSEYPSSVRSTS